MQRGSINPVILPVKPAMDLSARRVLQVSAEGETVATEPRRHHCSCTLMVVCIQIVTSSHRRGSCGCRPVFPPVPKALGCQSGVAAVKSVRRAVLPAPEMTFANGA